VRIEDAAREAVVDHQHGIEILGPPGMLPAELTASAA
jgi:hypothetical protein